jgi:galactokinase
VSAGSRAAALFETTFAGAPEGLWSAPGRLNLIGEHTDYNDGFALPFAIPQRTAVAADPRSDGRLVVVSAERPGLVDTASAGLAPGTVSDWSAYPLGVLWALRQASGEEVLGGGLSLAIASDVPPGAGLSSSAALESATALAINDLAGLRLNRHQLAAAGRLAENRMVGAPTGILDQLASLLSRPDAALLLDCRDGETTPVDLGLAAAGLAVLVVDSGVQHRLADGGYAQRRAQCEAAAEVLGVRSLRDATLAGLEAARERLGDVLYRRARHVITENARVLSTVRLVGQGEPRELGPLITASHVSLRDDFEVSVPELDAIVEAALGAGALGARLVGGGFGGSALTLVPRERTDDVAAAVARTFAARGAAAPTPVEVHPSAAARREA